MTPMCAYSMHSQLQQPPVILLTSRVHMDAVEAVGLIHAPLDTADACSMLVHMPMHASAASR